jgi:hypothetical protein
VSEAQRIASGGRWARERERAAAAGLLSTAEAARRAGVSVTVVKRWERLGLVTNRGAGGKGHPALYAWEEVRTARERHAALRAAGGPGSAYAAEYAGAERGANVAAG